MRLLREGVMRIPVYCRDSMELLTVVEVPLGLIGRPMIRLTAYPRLRLEEPLKMSSDTVSPARARVVELDMVSVRLSYAPRIWIALTRQGEDALLLLAEPLPGQRTHLHRTAWKWRVDA